MTWKDVLFDLAIGLITDKTFIIIASILLVMRVYGWWGNFKNKV